MSTPGLTPEPAAEDVERVARVLLRSDLDARAVGDPPSRPVSDYRRLAAAALAEMRPTAAEEAVKQVEVNNGCMWCGSHCQCGAGITYEDAPAPVPLT